MLPDSKALLFFLSKLSFNRLTETVTYQEKALIIIKLIYFFCINISIRADYAHMTILFLLRYLQN